MNNFKNKIDGIAKGIIMATPIALFLWVAILSLIGAMPFIKAYFEGQ